MISAGLDECGWGSWAGPLISVVATFKTESLGLMPPGVTDSKKTTDKTRSSLYMPLCNLAFEVGIGHAWPWEIDADPFAALHLSYTRAMSELKTLPDKLYVDGRNYIQGFDRKKQVVEPKADLKYRECSAASIIGKYLRDEMMKDYAKQFPGYGWEENAGYGTLQHEQAIHRLGLIADTNNHSRYMHRLRYCQKALLRGKK